MVRSIQTNTGDHFCLFASISAMLSSCVNHVRKYSRKRVIAGKKIRLRSTRPLMTTISSKAMRPFSRFNKKEVEKGGFEEGGLWQKGIPMGEKCQPPEFSGVIYYDYDGNRISELPPRSPRASPLPATTFSFPVMVKDSI